MGEISRAGPRRGNGGSDGGNTSDDMAGVDPEGLDGGDDEPPAPRPRAGDGSRGRTPVDAIVPERRAAIGTKQVLSVEEYGFLDYAFEHDLPVKVQQRNPKAGASRARYEKYKPARTLREIKRLGGSWADIVWDFERTASSGLRAERST